MPFANQYKPYIAEEVSVSKSLIKPRNIYKITSYVYADGAQKNLSGNNTAYVFVLGITTDKKISCIKFSEIKPDKFFRWLKPLFRKGITDKKWEEAEKLNELIIVSDKTGSKLFNQFVKTHSIYNANPDSYRTYSLQGIKQVQEVKLKTEFLKTLV